MADGRKRLEDVPVTMQAAVRHSLLLHCHHLACDVLTFSTREGRRAALDRVPESIRDMVEAEAIRLFKHRNELE